jgi:hypothetical protein
MPYASTPPRLAAQGQLREAETHRREALTVFQRLEARSDAFNRSLVWRSAKPLKWYKLKPLSTVTGVPLVLLVDGKGIVQRVNLSSDELEDAARTSALSDRMSQP